MPKTVDIDLLRTLVSYDPLTGKFVWLVRSDDSFGPLCAVRAWNAKYAGKPAFTNLNKKGYFYSSIFNVKLLAHRVGWALHYGKWPEGHLDHDDRNQQHNWIANLKPSTPAENNKNRNLQSNNTSGINGVTWNARTKAWRAQIQVNGKNRIIGTFPTRELAKAARQAEETKFNFHPNHGRAA